MSRLSLRMARHALPRNLATLLQLTSSLSMPLDLPVRTKVFADMGFQMNYNLPYDPASFYNATIWADELARRHKRQLDYGMPLPNDLLNEGIHPQDFTAGEMYAGLERLLPDYGFHRSCLLRSVCELALHPFAEGHKYNLITQIIVFLLTPSQHEGFSDREKLYRKRYERAEQIGFLGGDCQRSYPKCELDILSIITRLVR
ncbi:uncharacterized protein [Drosophila tropicalis]|uniref:uncharacterized protein isoform X1 n=1 Tax=Drosophila tropicalis TaxID=46794 RepID=UPI0035AB822A